MIIGVDAGALSITDDRLKVGVYRVTKNALTALALIDKVHNYRLYTFGPIEEGILHAFEGRAEFVQLRKLAWHRIWLPLELKMHPVDAFLGFAQSLPLVHTLCDIGFIYDLGFLHEQDAYGKNAEVLKKQTEALVSRADHIITISQASKTDILWYYGKPELKSAKLGFASKMKGIRVAYPGIDDAFSPVGEKYAGPNPYFLFVGSLNKAKDLPTLLMAFAQFCRRNATTDLVLIGGDYWPDNAIDPLIQRLHLENRVKKLGFVPDEALPAYYRGAVAFATTALREGFCLPAAEAMACGTPVVALDRGALKEVVGEGGIIVSRKSKVPGLAARAGESLKSNLVAAMQLMTDAKIRDVYSKRALEQAKKYRWGKFAKIVLDRINIR